MSKDTERKTEILKRHYPSLGNSLGSGPGLRWATLEHIYYGGHYTSKSQLVRDGEAVFRLLDSGLSMERLKEIAAWAQVERNKMTPNLSGLGKNHAVRAFVADATGAVSDDGQVSVGDINDDWERHDPD